MILGIDAVHLHTSRKAYTTMPGPTDHSMTWQQEFSTIKDDSHMMAFMKDSIAAIRGPEACT